MEGVINLEVVRTHGTNWVHYEDDNKFNGYVSTKSMPETATLSYLLPQDAQKLRNYLKFADRDLGENGAMDENLTFVITSIYFNKNSHSASINRETLDALLRGIPTQTEED